MAVVFVEVEVEGDVAMGERVEMSVRKRRRIGGWVLISWRRFQRR